MRGRILYVEDSPETRELIRKLLALEGYDVVTANSYAEALEISDAARIDLLIADLGLPDRSGLSLLGDIRKRHPAKGIVLSGYDIGSVTFAAGYSAHMQKPIQFERLSSLVAELLERSPSVCGNELGCCGEGFDSTNVDGV